jgi:hypothetical protein
VLPRIIKWRVGKVKEKGWETGAEGVFSCCAYTQTDEVPCVRKLGNDITFRWRKKYTKTTKPSWAGDKWEGSFIRVTANALRNESENMGTVSKQFSNWEQHHWQQKMKTDWGRLTIDQRAKKQLKKRKKKKPRQGAPKFELVNGHPKVCSLHNFSTHILSNPYCNLFCWYSRALQDMFSSNLLQPSYSWTVPKSWTSLKHLSDVLAQNGCHNRLRMFRILGMSYWLILRQPISHKRN